jgi:hypothetical protein
VVKGRKGTVNVKERPRGKKGVRREAGGGGGGGRGAGRAAGGRTGSALSDKTRQQQRQQRAADGSSPAANASPYVLAVMHPPPRSATSVPRGATSPVCFPSLPPLVSVSILTLFFICIARRSSSREARSHHCQRSET